METEQFDYSMSEAVARVQGLVVKINSARPEGH